MTDAKELYKLANVIVTSLRQSGKLPARMTSEDYNDLLQEGVMAALPMLASFDSARGSLRAYAGKAMARAILSFAWRSATVGITGQHHGIQVWSSDDTEHLSQVDITDGYDDDPAEVEEAIEHIEHLFS
jgi:DNA-directed RNA polymerase specialized sigma24 family protein